MATKSSEKKSERKASFFSLNFLPAIAYGLEDAINPYYLLIFLIFSIFLSYFGKTRSRIFWTSFFYWATVVLISFAAHTGVFDLLLVKPAFEMTIWILTMIFSVLVVFLGIVHLRDWVVFRKTEDINCFKIKLPCF